MSKPQKLDPTSRNYSQLTAAYDHFNAALFDGRLPTCLITLQRKNKSYGYFAGERFGTRDGSAGTTDEIALNPTHFKNRSVEQTLSTLVHEMTHVEQHHFGKPSRAGYHNAEWATLMKRVGLIPSSTGEPGGREVGQRVSHYIETGGRFERACASLIKSGFTLSYVELWTEDGAAKKAKKAASKTKYVCPDCGVCCWAKPATFLICGACSEASDEMVALQALETEAAEEG